MLSLLIHLFSYCLFHVVDAIPATAREIIFFDVGLRVIFDGLTGGYVGGWGSVGIWGWGVWV